MNIAEFAIKKKTITLVMAVLLVVGGAFCYERLGRLEDPEFTIKDALVVTSYPGASAEKVQAEVTDKIAIPTIGIGAGTECDGQVLVLHDLLGLTLGRLPRHVKPYADLKSQTVDAVTRYRDEVRDSSFPGEEQTFH